MTTSETTSVDLHAWCRSNIKGFRTFESREWAVWPSPEERDLAIVKWVLLCLGNPANADAIPVLDALAERHEMRVTR